MKNAILRHKKTADPDRKQQSFLMLEAPLHFAAGQVSFISGFTGRSWRPEH